MNRVVLVGRLTKDPDLKYTPNGVPVATFTLAVNVHLKPTESRKRTLLTWLCGENQLRTQLTS
jgi:single-strand DNA-binding protein